MLVPRYASLSDGVQGTSRLQHQSDTQVSPCSLNVCRNGSAFKSALQHGAFSQHNGFTFDHGRARWQHQSRAGCPRLPAQRRFQAAKATNGHHNTEEGSSMYGGMPASTAEWTNIMQQQLPPGHSLQPLLQPLLQSSNAGSNGLPGDNLVSIAAASTSLTVGSPQRPPLQTTEPVDSSAARTPAVAGLPARTDVVAREVAEPPAAKLLGSHWVKQVAVVSFAAMLCYLDRTNISTAIVPMVSPAPNRSA